VSQTRGRRLPADPEYCSDLPGGWSPPPLRSPSGDLVTSGAIVTESFATGDRVYVRGDLLQRKGPAIKAVRWCISAWSPPPVHTSAPDMRSRPLPRLQPNVKTGAVVPAKPPR
jgi:hypothetical protein